MSSAGKGRESRALPVDAVILDVDGTVATCPIDFDAMRAAVRRVAATWGFDTETLPTRGVIEQIDRVAAELGDRAERFREEASEAIVAIEVEAAEVARLLPGATEALARLRQRGVAVGLITRNCRGAAEVVLREMGEYDVLLARDDVPRPKPDADHVLRSLAAIGRTPDRAAVVGDHAYDMRAGRAAGARLCIGVRSGTSSDASLFDAGADAVVDSVADLPDWLEDHGRQPT